MPSAASTTQKHLAIKINIKEILVQVVVSPTLRDRLSFSTAREYRSSYTATQGKRKMLLRLDRSPGMAERVRG